MKSKLPKNSKAFTLIELLVVVTIIGILSGIVLVNINVKQRRNDAFDATIRANILKLSEALEIYYVTEGTLPAHDANFEPTGLGSPPLNLYLRDVWPEGEWPTPSVAVAGREVRYYYVSNPATGQFLIHHFKGGETYALYWKYDTAWGTIKECNYVNRGTFGYCDPVPPSP